MGILLMMRGFPALKLAPASRFPHNPAQSNQSRSHRCQRNEADGVRLGKGQQGRTGLQTDAPCGVPGRTARALSCRAGWRNLGCIIVLTRQVREHSRAEQGREGREGGERKREEKGGGEGGRSRGRIRAAGEQGRGGGAD